MTRDCKRKTAIRRRTSDQKVYIQLFRKRLSEKVHATIPRGIVGGFEITVLHRNFERMARETMDYVSEC